MFVEPIFMLECGTPAMCYTQVSLRRSRSPVSGSGGFGVKPPKQIFMGGLLTHG